MRRERQIQRRLNQVDWDFEAALSHYGVHRIHWYPGTFIPQIPAYLIELFSDVDETVFDPFCGVGTTLVEAVRLGRRAVGVDVNPIATRVANAKLAFFQCDKLSASVRQFGLVVEKLSDLYGAGPSLPLFASRRLPYDRVLEVLRPWYHDDTWREMIVLRKAIGTQRGRFRLLLDVTFSSIAKRCSSQRNHWGYVADNMIPMKHVYINAIDIYQKELQAAVAGLGELRDAPLLHDLSLVELNRRSKIMQLDVREKYAVPEESVDLIVTSPPYPNVTDYVRSQRLSMWWFNEEPNEIREREIGARFKRQRKKAVVDYMEQMELSFRTLTPALKHGRYMCVVIDDSDRRAGGGRVMRGLVDMITLQGFVQPFDVIRRRPSNQRLLSRTGRTNSEIILIFRKI